MDTLYHSWDLVKIILKILKRRLTFNQFFFFSFKFSVKKSPNYFLHPLGLQHVPALCSLWQGQL
jgi:hypothetical protein